MTGQDFSLCGLSATQSRPLSVIRGTGPTRHTACFYRKHRNQTMGAAKPVANGGEDIMVGLKGNVGLSKGHGDPGGRPCFSGGSRLGGKQEVKG
jgi:hypothetical protein